MSAFPRTIRLVKPEDTFARGWTAGDHSVIQNLGFGCTVPHVVWVDSTGKALYDQVLLAQSGGAYLLPVHRPSGKIALVRALRAVVKDMDAYRKQWQAVDPKNAEQVTQFALDCSDLCRFSWEIPRGMAQKWESLAKAAKREGQEESRYRLIGTPMSLGPVNGDTTFFPHLNEAFWCELELSATDVPEDKLEGIGPCRLVSLAEFDTMVDSHEIICAPTETALRRFERRNPGVLR